jgi:hypothetical protein
LKGTESAVRGGAKDVIGASQADNLSAGQCGRDVENHTESGLTAKNSNLFVPVVDVKNNALMPTSCSRARRWIKSGKATGFWKKGIYCVRLNVKPSSTKKQQIAVGIDTGSKREAFTIKSKSHTYLNIQTHVVDWVKENVETRRNARINRRNRTTPYRRPKINKRIQSLPPSTKSRWQWKLRLLKWLTKMYPITDCIVEDICAVTKKNCKKWNKVFSPLQSGKNWFYSEINKTLVLHKSHGFKTQELRKELGLVKSKSKFIEKFQAHCVDSWVLANSIVNGHSTPDNINMILIKPLRFHRRHLHVQNPVKGGIRKRYGGTISFKLKRGSLAMHVKYNLIYIGGCSIIDGNERISIYDIKSGKRITQCARYCHLSFITYNNFIVKIV